MKIDRRVYIMERLKNEPYVTLSSLAFGLDCPEPSIRRTIQELRAQGHNISFSPMGYGEYRLGSVESTPVLIAETPNELNPVAA